MARNEEPDEVGNDNRRPSPQSDPTNPMRQEAVGHWVAAERNADKGEDEEDRTKRNRDD